MDENGIQDELNQMSQIDSADKKTVANEQASENRDHVQNEETSFNENVTKNAEAVFQVYNYSQSQLQWMDRQVSNLEREMLLNNNKDLNSNFMSNWTKVILSALAVAIPGIGQIIGIIIGLVFVSNDINADKRSFGAALLTVSVVAFVLTVFFWFIFALIFGPQLY